MAHLLEHDDANNGLITKIWGPGMWIGFHSVTFGYPMKPTDEQRRHYRTHFETLGEVLPCRYCRDSYKLFITEEEETRLTDAVFENRATLTEWGYRLHNRVNRKLGVDYGISYEDVVRRYESYRAKCHKSKENEKAQGCVMPLRSKMKPYSMAAEKQCPVIPKKLAKRFMKQAIERGITEEECRFFDLDFDDCDHYDDLHRERNRYCREIIDRMRIEGVEPIDRTGFWDGFPAPDELRLIVARCSTIPTHQLAEIADKLNRRCFRFTSSSAAGWLGGGSD